MQKWGSGETYPTAENLRALIAALLALNTFTKEQEYDEVVELSDQHDYVHATQLFEESMALRDALGEQDDEEILLGPAARQARAAGQYRRATGLLEERLALQRSRGDRGTLTTGGLGLSLYELGLVRREQGDFAGALALFEECIQLHRTLGDSAGVAVGLLGLSDVARDQGDVVLLRKYCGESLDIVRKLGMQWAIGFALHNLALAAYMEGDWDRATEHVAESLTLFRSLRAEPSVAEVLLVRGQIGLAQNEEAVAYAAFTETLRIAWPMGPRLLVPPALEGLARLALETDRAELATRLLGAATALRARMGTPVRPAEQPAVERMIATARARFGLATFAQLWQSAGELPTEQILSTISDVAAFFASPSPGNAAPPHQTGRPMAQPKSRVDWGMAQEVIALYGREDELNTLRGWVLAEQCRVVALVGIGGIGKTSLALHFARQISPKFDATVFRSLGEAPPLPELLDSLIHGVTTEQIASPPNLSDKLSLLIDLLRRSRCLLVLDNLETLRQAGTAHAQYLPGYEAYGTFFQRLGETSHGSCVILTTRERLPELAALEGERTPVRTLRLAGLPEDACRALIADHALAGSVGDGAALARRYGGNPLALKLVAEPIRALFGGDIATFLSEGHLFFEGVGQLLAQQINRASPLEQALLTWMAIAREPVSLEQLMQNLSGGTARPTVLAALHALWRRNLIERGQANLTFTLQRVVLEYLTERLIDIAAAEVAGAELNALRQYALIQATAKEYVRRNQERLIAAPLLQQLTAMVGGAEVLEEHFLALLAAWRGQSPAAQGYGPGNIINLLRLLRGHLRGIDLSRLTIRQAYLQGVEAQDASLAGALLQDSPLTKTFDVVTSIAMSRSGEYWAAASRRGEVLVWTGGGQTLHRMWRAHTDMIWTIAFSPDERTLTTGSWDGAVKVWDVTSGALRWSGRHTSHANRVVYAPTGDRLASSGNDAVIRLWDLQSEQQIRTLPHDAPVPVIDWSPDGRILASGQCLRCGLG